MEHEQGKNCKGRARIDFLSLVVENGGRDEHKVQATIKTTEYCAGQG
jgi:hypothetical protein